MTAAFMIMQTGNSGRYWNLNSRAYENLRVAFGRVWSLMKTGKKLTEETCRKMSESRTGKALSESHRAAIGAGNRGKVTPDETRQRISEAKKGKTPNREMTESYRALLSRPKPKVICEHCQRGIAAHVFDRWHGDNCKQRNLAYA